MMQGAQKKALVIGISNYSYLRTLDICKNDGTEMFKVLSSLGYEISDNNKLIGEAKGEKIKDVIYDFFSDRNSNPDDTLLFYYSGHGVPDVDGDMYLASSDLDPDEPYRKGFSFGELSKMIQRSVSTKVVVILDSCYSGSVKLSKGDEESAAKLGTTIIEEQSKKLQGQGKCILSASQALQEAIALTTGEHSLFTHYILQGLKGDPDSTDNEGNVTPESLGMYAYREIMSLPADKRSKQKPLTRADGCANIVLASYPKLKSLKFEDVLKSISKSMLNLLREGKVQEFNKMREENSSKNLLDFSMENLHGIKIPGANLSSANLRRTNLSAADLEGANISNADLTRADLEGANLSKTNFSNAVFESSNLSNANLTRANLSNANLTRANLSNANLFSADLEQAKLIGADLRGTNLTEANLNGTDLRGAIFEEGRNHMDINSIVTTATTHTGILGGKTKILVAVLSAAAIIGAILSLTLFFHFNPFSNPTPIASNPHNQTHQITPNTPGNKTSGLNQTKPAVPKPNPHNQTHQITPNTPGNKTSGLNQTKPAVPKPNPHNQTHQITPNTPGNKTSGLNQTKPPILEPNPRKHVPLLPLDNITDFNRYDHGWNDGAIACNSGQTIPEINSYLLSDNYTRHHSDTYHQGYEFALAHCNIHISNGLAIEKSNP